MASTDAFFARLLGYHDMRVNGGSLLPRRNQINFIDGRVEDIDGETQITAVDTARWLTPSQAMTADINDFSPVGMSTLTELAFDPSAATRTVTGFDATTLVVHEKRVWNLSTSAQNLVIAHNNVGSAPNNRVLTPDGLGLTITPGNAAKLLRNATDSVWRVLPCLV